MLKRAKSRIFFLPALILFAAGAISFGVFILSDYSDVETVSAGNAPRWSQETGLGVSFPACGSSSNTFPTCSGGSPSVTISWTWTPDAAHTRECNLTNIGIYNKSGVQVQGYQRACNDSVTWTGGESGTIYTYNVYFTDVDGNPPIETKSGSLTIPYCTPVSASCSVSPATANIGEDVTWTAVPQGGLAPTTPKQEWIGDNTNAGWAGSPGGDTAILARRFQATQNYNLKVVSLDIGKEITVTGTLWVTIETDRGGVPSGSVVANGTSPTITEAQVPNWGSHGWIPFYFNNTPLVSGTNYWIVLRGSLSGPGNKIIVMDTAAADPNPGSLSLVHSWGAPAWTNTSASYGYRIYAPTYTYAWHGDTPLEGQTVNPSTVQYSSSGTKSGNVDVSDGVSTANASCGTMTVAGPPLPTCSASFSPSTVSSGQTSQVTWSQTDDADGIMPYSCTGNLGSGSITPAFPNPFTTGSITDTQTCTMTVQNSSGTRTCQASVTVIPPGGQSVSCSASPSPATTGQTVTWIATPSGFSGAPTYSWSGDASGSGSSVTASYSTTGTKTANVTAIAGAQSASNSCQVVVNPAAGGGPVLSVTPSCDGVTSRLGLSWTPYAGATQYNIRRCAGSSCTSYASATGYFTDGSWANLGNVGVATSYFDTAVSPGQTWSYVINTWDGDWNNPPSNISFATAISCGGGQADLAPQSLSTSLPTIYEGVTVPLSSRIKNIGTAATPGSFETWMVIDYDNDQPGTFNAYINPAIPTPALAAGEETIVNANWVASCPGLPAPCFHRIEVKADSGNVIPEVSEGNNVLTNGITVNPAVVLTPNLVANAISRSGTLIEGSAINFSIMITNSGGADAGASTGRYCLDVSEASCLASPTGQLSAPAVSPIRAGMTSGPYTQNWTATAGSHTVVFCVDVANTVSESDESSGSNCESNAFTVSTRPDLVANAVSRSGTLTAGYTLTFETTVVNSGGSTAGASTGRWCLDVSEASCLSSSAGQLSTPAISSLNPSQTSGTLAQSWTATAGSHTVVFCADVANTVSESDESSGSNCESNAFSIGAQTLSVNLTASPNSQPAPLNTNLTATVSGSAVGTINYTFWWNCTNTSSDVAYVSQPSVCGDPTNPAIGAKFNDEAATTKSVSHTYLQNATAKVIVERGAAPAAQDQEAIVVSLVASCSVVPPSAPVGNPVTWNASATGGDGNYLYSWSGSDSLSCSGQPSSLCYTVTKVYSSLGSKSGTVTVTSASQSDTRACGTVTITPGTSLNATPPMILPGGFSILTWDSTGFGDTHCTIDQGIGAVTADGTKPVSPVVGTIYTITCNDGINSDSASAVVNVAGTPTIKEIPPN